MLRPRGTFHPFSNALARLVLGGAVAGTAGLAWTYHAYLHSGYATGAGVAAEQPVPFSHEHHSGRLGVDCRFCHTGVEASAVAGIPPLETCMVCHTQVWTQAAMLEPVRAAYRERKPIAWTRTHALPDFVYFDHHVHVKNGVGCAECHGAVERMPLTWRANTLHMRWCVDCHRARSHEKLDPGTSRTRLLENCSVCHR